MQKPKKNWSTITDAKRLLNALEAKASRIPELLGFKSRDIAKTYKSLMSLANSLSIVFLQYDLADLTLFALQKAARAEEQIGRYGLSTDKLCPGQYKYSEALKSLYKAEDLVITISDSGAEVPTEVSISVNMVGFFILWKLCKFQEAAYRLEQAAAIVNSVLRGIRPAKFSALCLQSIYALIVMGLAALTFRVELDVHKAIQQCQDGLDQLSLQAIAGKRLLAALLKQLKTAKPQQQGDLLITKEYEATFYLAVFVPFISANTPVISAQELERAQRTQITDSLLFKHLKRDDAKRTDSSIARRPPRVSPARGLSVPRACKPSSKPWWESKRFLSQALAWPQADPRATKRPLLSFAPRLSPSVLKQSPNNHIMLEFSSDAHTEQVNLVPVDFGGHKATALDFFD